MITHAARADVERARRVEIPDYFHHACIRFEPGRRFQYRHAFRTAIGYVDD